MAVKSIFRSSNPSESFQSKTFQFSLGKVCLALEKFHKTQRSHVTNTPPTHHRPISYLISSKSGQCVGRLSVDCRLTHWPTRRWDRILYLYHFFYIHMLCDLLPVRFLKQVEGSLVRYEIMCGQHITRWIRSMMFMAS